jgi:hypothetical protein
MSDLKRILEVMNYQVGKPVTEQRNILLESYIPKFPAIFDIFKSVKNSVDVIPRPMSNWVELQNKLNSLFPIDGVTYKSFDDQIDALKNKMQSAGAGFRAMTPEDAKTFDELLESCWKELVSYIDDIVKIGDRMSWWVVFDKTADDILDIQYRINSVAKVDAATSRSFVENLQQIKTRLSSINQTYPYGKLIPDCEKTIDDLIKKLSPVGSRPGFMYEIGKILDFPDFVTSLRKWTDTFSKKTPSGKIEPGISDYGALIKRIKELSDELTDGLSTSMQLGGTSFNEEKFRRLSELIFMFKRDWDQDIWQYFEKLHSEGAISDDLFNYIKKQKESGEGNILTTWIDEVDKYRTAKIDTPERKAAEELGRMAFLDEFQGYWELFKFNPIFLITRSLTKGGRVNLGDDALKLLQRAFWLSVWADPRTPRELIKLRNVRGTTRLALLGGKFLSVAITQVLFGMLYSLILTGIQSGLDALEGEVGYDLVKWGTGDYMDPNWKGWDKYWENASKLIPDEFEKFFDGDVTFMEVAKGFGGMFTNLDNVWNTMQAIMNRETSDEDKEKAKSDLKKAEDELKRIKKEYDDANEAERKKYEEELKRAKDEIEKLEDKVENIIDNNQNGGGGNGQQVLPGLEGEMRTAFNNWANSNSNRRPEWVSFSGNVGLVKIDGNEKTLVKTSSGKFVITPTTPLIILN